MGCQLLCIAVAIFPFALGICRAAPPSIKPIAKPPRIASAATTAPSLHFATDAIPTDSSKYPYNHVACIAEMPNGDLTVVWVAGSKEAAKDTVIVASRRKKNEAAWSTPLILARKTNAGVANPVIFVDDRGLVWLLHVELLNEGRLCPGRVAVQTSDDSGQTWSAPRPAFDAMCTLLKNKPIITRNGPWVLPAYQEAIYQSQFWLSEDRGQTWKATPPLLTLPNNNLQPAVVELNDGSLLALMRNGAGTGFTWEARSKDVGKTWTLQQRHDLPNPGSGIDLIRLADGRLLLAFNPSPKDRTPLSVAVSDDDGRTWSSPKTIESGEPQLSYPSVIQSRDGTIHVVYSHRLSHIQHVEFRPSWVIGKSSDGRR